MAKRGPGWRKLTWLILAFNALMLIWIVSGVAGVSDNCEGEVGSALDACEAGTAIGAGAAATFLVFLWVAGDVILGVIWLITRKTAPEGRTCPMCATPVPVGEVVCRSCGYDYRTGQQGPVPDQPRTQRRR